ncbi:hypothetical protein MHH60_26845 [Paenibacillus sp. FSL H7-0716]|nr:hypothetical protein [Paenibacillus odorifer]
MSIYDFQAKSIHGEPVEFDRNGHVYGRYETTTEPFDIEPFIESLLLK